MANFFYFLHRARFAAGRRWAAALCARAGSAD
jgi:hypothetical protein